MKESKHTIPEEYLEEIKNSPTRRHAKILAGWLNRSHGDTSENRRAIQNAASQRKANKTTDDLEREPWGKPGGGCPGGKDGQGWEP